MAVCSSKCYSDTMNILQLVYVSHYEMTKYLSLVPSLYQLHALSFEVCYINYKIILCRRLHVKLIQTWNICLYVIAERDTRVAATPAPNYCHNETRWLRLKSFRIRDECFYKPLRTFIEMRSHSAHLEAKQTA